MPSVGRKSKDVLRSLAILLCPAMLGAALALAAPDPKKPDFAKPLPGPWWGDSGDDVQYFPPGPEFKLSREAAALAAAKRDAANGGSTLAPQFAPPVIGCPTVPAPGVPAGPAAPVPMNPGAAPVIPPAAQPGVIQ